MALKIRSEGEVGGDEEEEGEKMFTMRAKINVGESTLSYIIRDYLP